MKSTISKRGRGLAFLNSTAAALGFIYSAQVFAQNVAAGDSRSASATEIAAADTQLAANNYNDGVTILVTARHREEAAQDIPIALSVVKAETLEKTGDFTLGQIQHEIPSLQVVNTNPRNTNITIRGLGANSSLAVDGLEYGVGFYLDGVYYARPGQSQFDLIDLSQIEVLRGPQGTLFGKNTTAGAINVTSRLPSFEPELTGEASLGNYNYAQIRVTGSAPLIADKAALRLSVSDTHRDGFLTNLWDNSKAQNYDNFSIRGQLLITPNPRLSIRLIGDYSNQRQHYILTQFDGYFTSFANGAHINNNIYDRAARVGYALPTYGVFARLGNSNSPFQANMKSFGGSGEIDYDLDFARLTSITAYRKWDWWPHNDVDGTPFAINLQGQQQNFQRQFSQELRIASNGHHFIDYQAGLYYFWQTVPGYGANQYGPDFGTWTGLPPGLSAALANAEADSYSVANTHSYAAFGQADVHLTDNLTFTGGLRFTHEDKKGQFVRWQNAASVAQLAALPGGNNGPTAAQFALSPLSFGGQTHNNAVSGLATVSYKVARDVLIYGTYSHGSKSGGLNITAGGVLQPVVNPEKVDNFELGLKSQFLNRTVTLNAAAFLTDVSQFQANISQTINNITIQYIANIPKVRSKGIEADAAWAPSEWVSLGGSLAYTDAKYVRYANAPIAPENFNLTAALGGAQDLSGVALPGVSKFAFTLSADLAQPVSDGLEVYAHADYLHRSSFNSTPTNSVYGIVPAYGLLNARLGLRTANGRYDFALWAKNLADTRYYVSRSPVNYGLITAVSGDPRTFGATVRVKL